MRPLSIFGHVGIGIAFGALEKIRHDFDFFFELFGQLGFNLLVSRIAVRLLRDYELKIAKEAILEKVTACRWAVCNV